MRTAFPGRPGKAVSYVAVLLFGLFVGPIGLRSGPGQVVLLRPGAPWQRLYFRPEPQGQGSLRDTLANLPFPDEEPSLWCSTSPVSVGAEYSSLPGRLGSASPFATIEGASPSPPSLSVAVALDVPAGALAAT